MYLQDYSGAPTTLRLYDTYNQRLYINAEERQRFIAAAQKAPKFIRQFALTLVYTGCRLSEARELTTSSIQAEARILSIRSLKKRNIHVVREVPIPKTLVDQLKSESGNAERLLWEANGQPVARITAYRWIKDLMATADIRGAQACPKGLRHGYGVNATLHGVQIHMLQRWMGHASIKTTAIYATVLGPDQLELADRMWEK